MKEIKQGLFSAMGALSRNLPTDKKAKQQGLLRGFMQRAGVEATEPDGTKKQPSGTFFNSALRNAKSRNTFFGN
jgi:hypothetical protein